MDAKEIITQRIIDIATAKAKEIIDAAEQECENQKRRAQKDIDAQRAKALIAADYECEIIRSRNLVANRLENRKAELQSKQDAIFKVYQTALENIYNDENEYKAVLEKLLRSHAANGDGVIICARDKGRFGQWFDKICAELKLTILNEMHNETGGFILRKNKYDERLTLTSLFKQLREKNENEVVGMLFN